MARWALLLIFGTLLLADTAWLEEASDIEESGDDVDYVDGDAENVSNGSITESINWDGRRATPTMPGRQRIWKAIRREVRDMKNILPTLASNISFMEVDVRDMSRNFYSIVGDVRFIKNEVMYIKRQAHVIWENVTDVRRDHKRMNKTLWWILGNVTRVIEDVDKTSMAITNIGTSYGSVMGEMDKVVNQVVDVQAISNNFQNMRSEVSQLRMSMEFGSKKMTEEIDIIRNMVTHLSHDIVGIKNSFAEGFSNVDYYVNTVQSRILANVSAIDSKVRNYGGLLNSITDNVANIGNSLAGFSGRINDVWDLTRNIGGHMDQFDTRILKVGDQMTGVYDNVGQVNALISNVGYQVTDVGRQLSDMEHHMGAVGTQFVGFLGSVNDNFIKVNVHLEDVHDRIISNVSSVRGDLAEMKGQLRDIRQVIADKCEGACPNGQPSNGNGDGAVPHVSHRPDKPQLVDEQVATAKPDAKPPDYPSIGIPLTTPVNGDFLTEPERPPDGYPPTYPPTSYPYPPPPSSTYPWTTMPGYPYPPTSTSPYPPVYVPTSTVMPTPMPVYPYPPVPSSPYPPAHVPTSTYAPTLMPGYPYPSTTTAPYPPVHQPTSTYAPIPLPGYPSEHPSLTVPPPPVGYPAEYPSTVQPPYWPTTAFPFAPGYPVGYPPEYPSNGQPSVPPYLPTTASPLPPSYPNGYPSEYPSNGLPTVPPYFPTTPSPPTPPPYSPQPVPSPPSDYPHPSIPPVQPVHPRPTIPVAYPPIYPEIPSESEPLPIGIPEGPDGVGLPIGCGDEFSGYCACLCPCDCTCPVFSPTQSSIQTTNYERFPYPRKQCQCLCSCRCRSSAIFDGRPMTPSLHPLAAETHTDEPMFQPPPTPNIPWTTHSPSIPNGRPTTPVVSFPRPAHPVTSSPFDRPSEISASTEPVETDMSDEPKDCCSSLKEYFSDEISWLLEAMGYEFEHKIRKLQEELYTFFDGVIRFHVDVSDLAEELKTQLSLAAANIIGALNAIASKVQSLQGYDSPLDNAWFASEMNDDLLPSHRPIAQRPAMNPPEFTSPGQLPSYFPNMPNTRPQARPGQLIIPQLPPNPPTSRPLPGRPNISIPQPRPSQRPASRPQGGPPGRPQGGPPGKPQGGPPGRPLGGPPGRPLGGPPGRPQGGPPGSPQGGPPERPQGYPLGRPQGVPPGRPQVGKPGKPQVGLPGRPQVGLPGNPQVGLHGRPQETPPRRPPIALPTKPQSGPMPRPYERPSGRPQYPGQSSSQSSERPPRRPSEFGQNNLAASPSKPNIVWTQSRKLDNETVAPTTELSEYLSDARRYLSIGDESERESRIANTSFAKAKMEKKTKNKTNKVCIDRRRKIGVKSDSSQSTLVGDKELALVNAEGEIDDEDDDDIENDGDSYDVTVVPEVPIEMPGTELAIPDEDVGIVETPIDQFNFQKMLQDRINEQIIRAVRPGSDYRSKGKRFPLSPWRGRPRNRYKFRPRPFLPMIPKFPFIRPPMGFQTPIPPIGIPIPRIPIPNPLGIRPPRIPDILGSLPPGVMVGGTKGAPYSVSYNDGRGNSWNVNVNRRNYQAPSGTKADKWNDSEDELKPQDEAVQQETEEEIAGQEELDETKEDNDSDEDEIHQTTKHEETNEEAR